MSKLKSGSEAAAKQRVAYYICQECFLGISSPENHLSLSHKGKQVKFKAVEK